MLLIRYWSLPFIREAVRRVKVKWIAPEKRGTAVLISSIGVDFLHLAFF